MKLSRHPSTRLLLAALVFSARLMAQEALPEEGAAPPGTPPPQDEAVVQLLAGIEAAMVPIPGGSFRMGDLSGRGFDDERPVHTVTIKPFRLSAFEATFDQFDAYAKAAGRGRPGSSGLPRGSNPAINVNLQDVAGFISWLNEQSGLNYRLPSEAEWEYAARAGTSTNYPWGDAYDPLLANGSGTNDADKWNYTAPVGSFPANAWGLFDMTGNVWEWTADCYEEGYAGAPKDGSARSSSMGPEFCLQVIRGGSWSNDPANLRVSDRSWHSAEHRYYFLGFRLARDEPANAPPASGQ